MSHIQPMDAGLAVAVAALASLAGWLAVKILRLQRRKTGKELSR